MQRFQFSLDTVLEWRRSQLDAAECKLRDLFAEAAEVQHRFTALDHSEHQQRERLKADDATAAERVGFDAYLRWVNRERDRLRTLAVDCDQRIATQRSAVVAARRDFELLEKLKGRRLSEWHAGVSRELEQLAAEAYLAKFNRDVPS
jgi:flagellar biosynthesis chaperone FliJ